MVQFSGATIALQIIKDLEDLISSLKLLADSEQTDCIDRRTEKIQLLRQEIEERRSTGPRKSYEDESELMRLGYQITGLTDIERWEILSKRCVPLLDAGKCYRIIENLIDVRRLQRDGEHKFRYAIRCWQMDLDRLVREYDPFKRKPLPEEFI